MLFDFGQVLMAGPRERLPALAAKMQAADAVLQAAQCRWGAQTLIRLGSSDPLGGHLQGRILSQGGVVIEIFVAQGDGEYALRQHLALTVLDQGGMTGIGQAIGDRINQMQPFIHFAEQKNTGKRSFGL